ncbi:MAG: TonB-dependent receptor, partial [Rubrivivax sp.]|nr:TonB-dependent receptor [Pyrinomonadaceae bacterium]
KNKLFFFTTYEKWKDSQPLTLLLTVPTELERRGDFSQSRRTNGVVRNIFNPFTSTGTNGVRTAFTGNVIPTALHDPTALRLLAEIPVPNLPGNDLNWQGVKNNNTEYWNFSTRADWNFSEKWKTFVRYGHFKANLLEVVPEAARLIPQNGSNRYGLSVAADTVYTLSPKMVLNVRGNYHQVTDEYAAAPSILGEDGLAALWPGNPWYEGLFSGPNIYYPALDVPTGTTNNRLGRPGREFFQHPQGWGFSGRLNYYAGDHSTKFGGEFRVDKGKGARFEPLNFFFRQNLTANRGTSPDLVNTGNEWATFLLGALEPNGTGNTNNNFARLVPLQEVVSLGYASYFQDDWKVTSRLSLNLGLRWEYEPGPVDAQNRLSRMIDLTNPIPEFQTNRPAIPAVVTNLLAARGIQQSFNGAWVFADENNRNAWNRKKLNLLPRLGMAYRLDDRSVIRFGYARYLSPSARIRDPLGDFVEQYTGFATTTFALPNVNGLPQQRLSDPFPANRNPVQQEVGQSLGRYTNLGNSFTLDALEQRPPINDRFSLSYQREIWGRVVLDLDYFMNRGSDLPYTVDLNMVDPEYSFTIPRSVLNQSVANPFFNILTPQLFPGSLRNQATVSVASLLRPFPQYGAINQANTPGRKEKLQSFSIQAQRPFSKGVSFIVAYAYNREQTTEFFDDFATFARRFEWFDTEIPRHRFTNAITMDVPIGKGRWLLKEAPKALDYIVGGWQFTTTTRLYSGRLLQFGQSLIVNGDPAISGATKGANGQWFDTSVFSALPTSSLTADPPNLARRTNPRSFPGVNGPSVWQTDMTMSKGFHLTERFRLEARVEAYNAFNHLNWDNPGVDFNNKATFGKVTRRHIAFNGREVQYGLRLVF